VKLFDGRKWTERRITKWSLGLSVVSLLVALGSIGIAWTSAVFDRGVFCYNELSVRQHSANINLYKLPRLLSGCGIQPQIYCKDARFAAEDTFRIVTEMENLINEPSSEYTSIDQLKIHLKKISVDLKQVDKSSEETLVRHADELIKIKSIFASTNLQHANCKDF
jgi:hypothetical protein